MATDSDLLNFSIAYRQGPREEYDMLRARILSGGKDLDLLIEQVDEFVEALDRVRASRRRGHKEISTDVEARYRKAASEYGFSGDYIDNYLAQEKAFLLSQTGRSLGTK